MCSRVADCPDQPEREQREKSAPAGCTAEPQAAGAAASIAVNYDNDIRAFDFGLLKNRLEELNEVK